MHADDQLPLGYTSRYEKPDHVGAPYAIGSETSKEAAKVVAKHLQNWKAAFFLCIDMAHEYGRTFDECVEILGASPTSSGRITALRDEGQIVDSGRTRKTRRGYAATVWISRYWSAAAVAERKSAT